jgi:hypothetical protein
MSLTQFKRQFDSGLWYMNPGTGKEIHREIPREEIQTTMARITSKVSGLEHFIWSTLPNSTKIAGEEHLVPHFVAKSRVDDSIKKDKSLLAKTTFLWVSFFGNNHIYPCSRRIMLYVSRLML